MIFISYSRKDYEYVSILVNISKSENIDVFIDINNLKYGDKWFPVLENAIYSCDKFYLFWSTNANKSKNVHREIEIALKKDNPTIIPLMIDNTPLPINLSEYNGFEYLQNKYNELIKKDKIIRFYKIVTIALSFLLILISSLYIFTYLIPLEEIIKKQTVPDYPPLPTPPNLVDDEIVDEFANTFNGLYILVISHLIIILILIFIFIKYRLEKKYFKLKSKEFFN